MHATTAHERKQTDGAMGKGGRKEGQERTGEETKDKEGSHVRGREDGRDGRGECERGAGVGNVGWAREASGRGGSGLVA